MSEKFKLTEEQRRGLDIDRAMGMVAGAGSGKTFVLTERFVRHLERARKKGYTPERALGSIVAMTYTRKAAGEMAGRIAKKCEELAQKRDDPFWHELAIRMSEASIGTIHSFCGKIVRRYPFMSRMNIFSEEGRTPSGIIEEIAGDFIASLEGTEFEGTYRALRALLGNKRADNVLAGAYRKRMLASQDLKSFSSESIVKKRWCTAFEAIAEKWDFDYAQKVAQQIEELVSSAKTAKHGDALASIFLEFENKLPDPRDPSSFIPLFNAFRTPGGSQKKFGNSGSNGNWTEVGLSSIRERCNQLSDKFDEIVKYISDEDLNELDEENARATVLFAKLYREFEPFADRELALFGTLDFDDLLMAAKHVIQGDALARDVGTGIEALLIDEFQDTDPIQWEIAERLGDFVAGNMFWVGDPKQSIYRFRGADVANVVRGGKYIERKDGSIEQLSKNFRTTREVLSFINSLGEHLFGGESPIDFDFRAKPQSLSFGREEATAIEGKIELIVEDETDNVPTARLVAGRISAIVRGDANGEGRLNIMDGKIVRPARWSDIAILYPTRTGIGKLKATLLERDIPHIELAGKGFFVAEEIVATKFMFQYLADRRDTLSLLGLLRGPLFALSDSAILAAHFAGGGIREGIRLAMTGDVPLADGEDSAQLLKAATILDELESMAKTAAPSEIFARAFELTGAWAIFAALSNGAQRIANIEKFAESCAGYDSQGLPAFADFLRHYKDEDEAEAPIEHEGADAVKLMTIHHAKGLEFPIVCAFGLQKSGKGDFPPFRWDPDFGALVLPSRPERSKEYGVAHKMMNKLESERKDAEKRRLLYVCATRARDHLILCSTKMNCGLMKYVNEFLEKPTLERGVTTLKFDGGEITARKGLEGVNVPPIERVVQAEGPIYASFPAQYISDEMPSDIEPITAEGVYSIRATDLPFLGRCPKREVLKALSDEGFGGGSRGKGWGTIVHEFLERMPCPIPAGNEVERIAREVCEGTDFPDGASRLIKIAKTPQLIALFAKTPEIDLREERVVFRQGKLIIAGVIDRIWKDSAGWHILDYKSDAVVGSRRAERLMHHAPQLAIYRSAASAALKIPESEIETSVLFTHDSPEILPIPEIDLAAVIAGAEEILSHKNKTAPANCESCPYEKDCARA